MQFPAAFNLGQWSIYVQGVGWIFPGNANLSGSAQVTLDYVGGDPTFAGGAIRIDQPQDNLTDLSGFILPFVGSNIVWANPL